MTRRYDAIIIGTGQAGPPLAGRFHEQGKRVAILERGAVGGTCVNTGCIPTKTLVASARVAHMARRAADFGVVVGGEVGVDFRAVTARMRSISGESNEGVTKWLEGMEGVDLVRGHAQLESARTVRANGELYEAPQIFLNVGGRARTPELPGLDEIEALTNSSLLQLDRLPEHLVIVGGSYIGLEFGQMFRRFGSRVTIVQRGPRLIAHEDVEVSEVARELLEKEGIDVRCEATCTRVRRGERGGVVVGVECAEGTPEIEGSHLLLAVGRVPNTDALGLEAAGVETDERGFIAVDDTLRTTADGIWALGDCNGKGAFTHTSYNDFEIVAANLFDDDPRKVSDRIPCYALYVDPPLGRIGVTKDEARRSGRKVLVGRRPMAKVGRAKERSETDGFLEVLVDAASKRILGATVFGIGGDEVVHVLLAVMAADAPYTVISRGVHIHPTVSELLPTVLQGLETLELDEA